MLAQFDYIMLGQEVIKAMLPEVPECPGVYRMLGQDGALLYIGKARNLKKRVSNYTRDDLSIRISRMVFLTRKLEFEVTKSETEALLLEANLIRKLQPRYNILLKDDKSFPYIKLRMDHDFPQLIKYRGKKISAKEKLFGPFISSAQVDSAIHDLQKIFLIRPCSDTYFATRKRPCLQFQIKRCSAPCTGKISAAEYNLLTQHAVDFLSGKGSAVLTSLQKEMEEAAEKFDYEKAAILRDRIKALSYVQLKAGITDVNDADVIAVCHDQGIYCVYVLTIRGGRNYGGKPYFPTHTEDATPSELLHSFIGQFYQTHPVPKLILLNYQLSEEEAADMRASMKLLLDIKPEISIPQRGEKYELVKQCEESAHLSLKHKLKDVTKFQNIEAELRELFGIKHKINRIEIYDNSHIMGTHAVGGMVVAGPEGFLRSEYRSYNLPSYVTTGGDDYAMLKETLSRRLAKLVTEPHKKPDLIIIDGGKGHLETAYQVFMQLNITDITFVSMAKGQDRNSGREIFHQIGREQFTLPKDAELMRYLQILRDEAHNHAISTHRKKRSKAMNISSLDVIPGIGLKRNKLLLSYFGSLAAVSSATIEELCKVPTISKSMAKTILEYLKNRPA